MKILFIIYLLNAFVWISTASAVTIELDSGKIIEGDVVEKTDEYIKVQSKDQRWKISLKDLDEATRNMVKDLVVETPQEAPIPQPSGITNFDDPVTKEEGPLTKTMDLNKDGKEEYWNYSLRDGAVQKVVRDLDLNGTVDATQWTFLRNKQVGQFEKMIHDDNNDGIVDRIDYYDDQNKIIRSEENLGSSYPAIAKAELAQTSTDREKVLAYLVEWTSLSAWADGANEEVMKKSVNAKGQIDADAFFPATLTIQNKLLSRFKELKVPDVPEVKNFHNDILASQELVVKAMEAGARKDQAGYERLNPQVASLLKTVDENYKKLTFKYGINNQDVETLMSSGKLDIK